MTFRIDEKAYDLRISIIPGAFGEGVVIRILDPLGGVPELSSLGLSVDLHGGVRALDPSTVRHHPHHQPDRLGQSTTLYAVLKRVYTPRQDHHPRRPGRGPSRRRNADPNPSRTSASPTPAGCAPFCGTIRDIVMVGEIRDLDSAEIALRASLTGHLLFSTLHTNNAALAPTRLVDMGVPPSLVMSSLLGVLAQRLVRKLCPECKQERRPTETDLATLGLTALPLDAHFFRRSGAMHAETLDIKGAPAFSSCSKLHVTCGACRSRNWCPPTSCSIWDIPSIPSETARWRSSSRVSRHGGGTGCDLRGGRVMVGSDPMQSTDHAGLASS